MKRLLVINKCEYNIYYYLISYASIFNKVIDKLFYRTLVSDQIFDMITESDYDELGKFLKTHYKIKFKELDEDVFETICIDPEDIPEITMENHCQVLVYDQETSVSDHDSEYESEKECTCRKICVCEEDDD